jgi:hypothetical protein
VRDLKFIVVDFKEVPEGFHFLKVSSLHLTARAILIILWATTSMWPSKLLMTAVSRVRRLLDYVNNTIAI